MDKDSGTPRVFLIRHGQTEWSINGRHTGSTNIPLTHVGEAQVTRSSHVIIGPGKVVDPKNLTKVYVSPRTRARHTYELLFNEAQRAELKDKTVITQDIREWEYGAYEGLLTGEIQKLRRDQGLDKDSKWDIWRDGCENGESPAELAQRLDNLIAEIRKIQSPYMHGEKPADIVIIAHGHSLRAFAKRWINFPMEAKLPLMLEPGGVGVLSYEHHNPNEPALALGINLGTNETNEGAEKQERQRREINIVRGEEEE